MDNTDNSGSTIGRRPDKLWRSAPAAHKRPTEPELPGGPPSAVRRVFSLLICLDAQVSVQINRRSAGFSARGGTRQSGHYADGVVLPGVVAQSLVLAPGVRILYESSTSGVSEAFVSLTTTLLRRAAVPAAAALVAAGLSAVPASASPLGLAPAAAVPNPSTETLPTVQIDKGTSGRDGAVVWSQAVVGNTVYVGGDFTTARPAGAKRGVDEVTRTYLLAYDITTGNLLSFNHTLNGQVRGVAASPDGSRVYVTGDFTTVDGQDRVRIAAFSTADGSLVAGFRPVLGAAGLAVAATNTTVYAGGNFTKVSSKPGATLVNRGYLAGFSAADGAVSFQADANAPVLALAVTKAGDRLVAGGRFTSLAGTGFYGLGSVDPTTGAAQSFPVNSYIRNAGSSNAITSLYADSTGIYGTGYHFGGVGNLEGTFHADPASGKLVWVADCYGDTYSVFQSGGVVYDASHHHDCASTPGGFKETNPRTHHNGTAFTVEATGTDSGSRGYGWSHKGEPAPTMISWLPSFTTGYYTGMGQGPWSISGNAQYVSYGGEFQAVNNNKSQQGLVRFMVPGGGAEPGPAAAFTFQPSDLAVSFDASTSSGTIKTYAWDFGDGTTGTGVKASHTYAAGTYTVTLRVTDDRGATVTTSEQVLVAKAGPGAALASDSFGRTATSGWGTAPLGGSWKPDTKPAYFSVDGNRGLITIPVAGWTSRARMEGTNRADVEVNANVGVTKRPSAAVTRVWVSARTSSDFASGYLLRANVKADGQVESLQVTKRVAGTETVISTVANPGVTLGDSDMAQLRLRVVGTTVQGKVWKAGTDEPGAWQVQVSDGSVTAAGSVGVGAYTGASAAPLPVVVAFDNVVATAAG